MIKYSTSENHDPPPPSRYTPPEPTALSRRKVVVPKRYSAGASDLARLFKAARQDPYDTTRHAVIADAVDEAHPGNKVADLIRRQFGHGEYGGQGERNNLWYESVENSWDGTFPYAAHLGTHGPFNLYLRHEGNTGSSVTPASSTNARWVVHAVARMNRNPAHDDFGYTFEFPHEEAHLIPQMFPAAQWHTHPVSSPEASKNNPEEQNRNANVFDQHMDEQERNRE